MLFELFGDRSLIETLLRFPVCSAEQPAEVLAKFANTWKTRKDAVEYKRAQELSTANPDKRLSLQIHDLRQRRKRAAELAAWVDEHWQDWQTLKQSEKDLWEEHRSGAIDEQIARLRALQQPRPKGTGSWIARNMQR